ncbi:hypothetical protein IC762_12705 [Bradyrhizobium genosp. L]|nr:hypothetical protein IC762_12705 [Bradyrhizobium genosp. L]
MRLALLAIAVGLAVVLAVLPATSIAAEQDEPGATAGEAPNTDAPEPSRDQWRQRIDAARQRAKEVARERRENPQAYLPVPEDPDLAANRRILNDDSLHPGDIVTTSQGMFIYQGRPDQPRSPEDFVPVNPKPGR